MNYDRVMEIFPAVGSIKNSFVMYVCVIMSTILYGEKNVHKTVSTKKKKRKVEYKILCCVRPA